MLWHFHLGHPNFQYRKYLFPHLFSKVDVPSLSYDVCIRAKQHRVLFSSQPSRPTQSFTLIYSHVWRPSWITTASRKHLFHMGLSPTDKSEVSSIFQQFYTTVEIQFDTKIAILRNDIGREFLNYTLHEFSSPKGIVHQSSCVDTA